MNCVRTPSLPDGYQEAGFTLQLHDKRPDSDTPIEIEPHRDCYRGHHAEKVLESAYAWLCRRRPGYPSSADIWSFRCKWKQEKARLQAELPEGSYRVSLLIRVSLKIQQEIDLWSARAALVLKALSLVLVKHLPISKNCAHIKNQGGAIPFVYSQ